MLARCPGRPAGQCLLAAARLCPWPATPPINFHKCVTLVLLTQVPVLCCRDRLFVFGGVHPFAVDQPVSTDMHSFDLVTLQWQNWTQIGSVPKAR